MQTIDKGRTGRMPAHADFLGEAKVHLLAAYVYSLSHPVCRETMRQDPVGCAERQRSAPVCAETVRNASLLRTLRKRAGASNF
jgi:hypothetical protein